jgi:hypothetical protein
MVNVKRMSVNFPNRSFITYARIFPNDFNLMMINYAINTLKSISYANESLMRTTKNDNIRALCFIGQQNVNSLVNILIKIVTLYKQFINVNPLQSSVEVFEFYKKKFVVRVCAWWNQLTNHLTDRLIFFHWIAVIRCYKYASE